MLTKTSIYVLDTKQKLRVWSIWQESNQIIIEHGVMGGAMLRKTETVRVGKGRRTVDEQIALRVNSRLQQKYSEGYKNTPEEAIRLAGTNQLGLPLPMLAHPNKVVKPEKIDFSNAWGQYKYDGHRCLIHRSDNGYTIYSRKGHPIAGAEHVLDELDLPVGMTIDGELYAHGYSLEEISSFARKKQPKSCLLRFHAYDIVDSAPYHERLEQLGTMFERTPYCGLVPSQRLHNHGEIRELFLEAKKNGYEGAMLKWGEEGYRPNVRTQSVLKYKGKAETEFQVIDVEPSQDGWGILVCATDQMKTFKVNAPGTMEHKAEVLAHKEKYVGKLVTVEYPNYTKYGIPFHPVALRFREDL